MYKMFHSAIQWLEAMKIEVKYNVYSERMVNMCRDMDVEISQRIKPGC